MNNFIEDNNAFLNEIKKSLVFSYEKENNNRSSKKVDTIHGWVANYLQEKLDSNYIVKTKLTTGKEEVIKGRYFDKRVDILIENRKTNKQVAAIGIKFVLSSYQKNANNYFENLLGETANIRSNNIPYFQILIMPNIVPNFTKEGITSFTYLKSHHLEKYKVLSEDSTTSFFHAPLKTLIYIFEHIFSTETSFLKTKKDYQHEIVREDFKIKKIDEQIVNFDSGIIFNDFVTFIEKVVFLVKGFD